PQCHDRRAAASASLRPFPTRRSSDLGAGTATITATDGSGASASTTLIVNPAPVAPTITSQPVSQTVTAGQTATFSVTATGTAPLDRKSTRLNSSHVSNSYAVFCLQKK